MMERCGSFRFFLSLRWISMVSVTFWQSISLPLHPLMVMLLSEERPRGV